MVDDCHHDSLILLDVDTTHVKSISCMLCGVLLTWNTMYNVPFAVVCIMLSYDVN